MRVISSYETSNASVVVLEIFPPIHYSVISFSSGNPNGKQMLCLGIENAMEIYNWCISRVTKIYS